MVKRKRPEWLHHQIEATSSSWAREPAGAAVEPRLERERHRGAADEAAMVHVTLSCSRTGHFYDNLRYDIVRRPNQKVSSAFVSFLSRCPEDEHSCWMRTLSNDEVLGTRIKEPQ